MSSTASTNANYSANDSMARLIALENRTGYTIQQFNGQRRYYNPKWDEAHPPRGCEVFVGKIPRDLFEDELVPVFEKIGLLYELRLMMDFSGFNRGYAFVCYTCREHAQFAIQHLDNYEIRPGQRIGVCKSVDNCRLYVGGIPKDKTQTEIKQAMCEISEDVSDVIVYPGNAPGEFNRGFALVEYHTHRAAAMARRKLIPGRITLFGNEVVTDWAEPEVDANDALNRIKNVYVRNLKVTTSQHTIFAAFNAIRPGAIERVKKIEDRDYAFVHFLRREDALYAVQVMNGQIIDGQAVQISLAKPPSNKHDITSSQPANLVNRSSYTPSLANMTFPKSNPFQPASLSQLQITQQSAPDYTNLIRAQTTTKLQQSLQTLKPPMSLSHLMPPPKLPIFTPPYSLATSSCTQTLPPPVPALCTDLSNTKADCLCNGKKLNKEAVAEKGKGILEPVSTLDHIAKIQCPVVYLDELSTIVNNGVRPTYSLLSDRSNGVIRYVYQVCYMGRTYIPQVFSTNISEAQKVAAQYVLKQIDSWLRMKITELVNGSNVIAQKSVAVSAPAFLNTSKLFSTMNSAANALNLTSGWQKSSFTATNPLSQTSAQLSDGTIKRQSYNSIANSSRSVLGLSDSLWSRLSLSDGEDSSAFKGISNLSHSATTPSNLLAPSSIGGLSTLALSGYQ